MSEADQRQSDISVASAGARSVLGRRQFLISSAVVAGGLALAIKPLAALANTQFQGQGPWGPDAPAGNELSAWVEIMPNDAVMIRVPTPEIGNGAMTQVAMNVCEELDCAWSKVKVEFASVHRDYMEKGVYASGSLPFFGGHGTDHDRMNHALQLGASARERLKAAAAIRWNVSVVDIDARQSVLTNRKNGETLRYGEVAAEAAKVILNAEPALKPQREWTFLGKASPAKLNIAEIASGQAIFGIDVQVPGMVHAALKQAPVHGGKLKNHKPEAVLSMPGVRAVVVLDPAKTRGTPKAYQYAGDDSKRPKSMPRSPVSFESDRSSWGFADTQVQSAVAVIADHYWQAKQALDALPVEWDLGDGTKWSNAEAIYAAARHLFDSPHEYVIRDTGDVNAVSGSKIVEAVYATPYCENAVMEPLNGTALVTDDSVEVWCPTQDQIQAYWVAIDETGIAPQNVRLHQTFVGGGFGRRTMGDDVRMVVAVAKEFPGVPVKTIWSREECFAQGRYRTPVNTRFKAVLGDDGFPLAINSKVAFVGTSQQFLLPNGWMDMPYFTSGIVPNVHQAITSLPVNILNGAFRGPGYNSHSFIVETFIDECAIAAGIDPLQYRLKLVSRWDKCWTDCLRVAAEKAGWGGKLPRGEGMGIAVTSWPFAQMHNFGSIICAVARVSVSKSGKLEVQQVDIAFDCGRIANVDAVRSQIEGGTIFGMNMSLNEQLSVKNGAVVETNYDQYLMLRMGDDLPKINIHLDALSGHERFAIMGEAPVGPIGPAIGNAIFQATSKRLRSTPFRNHDLSWS